MKFHMDVFNILQNDGHAEQDPDPDHDPTASSSNQQQAPQAVDASMGVPADGSDASETSSNAWWCATITVLDGIDNETIDADVIDWWYSSNVGESWHPDNGLARLVENVAKMNAAGNGEEDQGDSSDEELPSVPDEDDRTIASAIAAAVAKHQQRCEEADDEQEPVRPPRVPPPPDVPAPCVIRAFVAWHDLSSVKQAIKQSTLDYEEWLRQVEAASLDLLIAKTECARCELELRQRTRIYSNVLARNPRRPAPFDYELISTELFTKMVPMPSELPFVHDSAVPYPGLTPQAGYAPTLPPLSTISNVSYDIQFGMGPDHDYSNFAWGVHSPRSNTIRTSYDSCDSDHDPTAASSHQPGPLGVDASMGVPPPGVDIRMDVPQGGSDSDSGSLHSPRFDDDEFHFFEEFHFGEMDSPDMQVKITVDKARFFIGVMKATTIEDVKAELLEETGLKPEAYYLRWNKRVMEDKYSMDDYGIEDDVEFEFVPSMKAAGKRGSDGTKKDGGGRNKQSKEEVVADLVDRMQEFIDRLARAGDDIVPVIIAAVNRVKDMQPNDMWERLQEPELESIQNTSCINGNVDYKAGKIARVVYGQYFANLAKRAKHHKEAEELMAQSIVLLLTKKFGNESGQIQWQSMDHAQTHTVAYNVMQAIKRKANRAGALGLPAAPANGDADV